MLLPPRQPRGRRGRLRDRAPALAARRPARALAGRRGHHLRHAAERVAKRAHHPLRLPVRKRRVRKRGVRFVDYPTLAREFALLQTDGKHWTHYAFPCHDQAPELTRLLAQLTMQASMDRPLDVCGGEGVR